MLGIAVLLSMAMLIFTVVIRWRLRDEDEDEEKKKEVAMPDFNSFEDQYMSSMVPPVRGYECVVCFSFTSTRCSRCKAVRYCSSKCQIIHWRQGHKYECHPHVPIAFERDYLNANAETMEQYERNGTLSAEGLSRMDEKGTIGQMHCDSSNSPNMIPRLSTVTMDSLDITTPPSSPGENGRPVLDSEAPNMVQEEENALKSASTGLVDSGKKLKREKSRQIDRRKTRASSVELPSGFKKDHSSDGAISGDSNLFKSKEIPDVDLLQNEGQKHSQTTKHRNVKSLTSKHSGNDSLPSRSSSSSSHLQQNGFKSSLQKVVNQLKTSHQKKPPLRNTLLKTLGNHSLKAVFQYDIFLRLFSSNDVELKPFGLTNIGNSCYANAVLQCLAYTRPLTLYLLQGLHSKECCKEEWCFTCEFENLILKAREGYNPLSPIRILSNIGHLGHGREEDAHEFLRYAVDTMQSVCIELAGFVDPVVEETTLIGMTFGGYLNSKIKCMKCHNKSEKYERMMDLTVEIDGDIRTLEQALKRFTASEILEGNNKYYCSRCKSYEKAKKKLTVFHAPNILTIVLKRFQAGNLSKLTKPVQFPESLNMTPYMTHSSDGYPHYSLYAVVVHLDVMNASFSGHYLCYVKNYYEEWFKIDDSEVISVDLNRVLSEEAYMLLYSRHSPRLPASARNTSHGELDEANVEAVAYHRSGHSAIPKARHISSGVSADSLVMQDQSRSNGYAKDPSYLDEWVTHSVESIPRVDSSSEVSSLFSHSEEGTCSTPSTRDSASVDDYSDYIFGRGSAAGC